MKNEQFYKIVIILLLLLNGGVLGYLWLNNNRQHSGPPHGSPHMGPDRIIIERVGLDEKQQETFQGLKEEHHRQTLDIQANEAKLHSQLFDLLKQAQLDTVAKMNILTQLKSNDSLKEEITFEHFRKLRAILAPDQQPKLDELVAELATRVMGDHRRPPPPGH